MQVSLEQRAHALSLVVAGMKREQIARTIGCTTESLRRWYAEAKRQGLVSKRSKAAESRAGHGSPVAQFGPGDLTGETGRLCRRMRQLWPMCIIWLH